MTGLPRFARNDIRCEVAGHPPAYPLRVLRDCFEDQSPDESGSYGVLKIDRPMALHSQSTSPSKKRWVSGWLNRAPARNGWFCNLSRTSRNQNCGHCEKRSDVAIQQISLKAFSMTGLPRFARNDIRYCAIVVKINRPMALHSQSTNPSKKRWVSGWLNRAPTA